MSFKQFRQLGTGILALCRTGRHHHWVCCPAHPFKSSGLESRSAITQPIRIDDVVIVENEWGKIEEITLTYVVVKIWDLRRLILPISYFIEKPFQNWTRVSADLLGTVYLYVDYSVPVEGDTERVASYFTERSMGWTCLGTTGNRYNRQNNATSCPYECTRCLRVHGIYVVKCAAGRGGGVVTTLPHSRRQLGRAARPLRAGASHARAPRSPCNSSWCPCKGSPPPAPPPTPPAPHPPTPPPQLRVPDLRRPQRDAPRGRGPQRASDRRARDQRAPRQRARRGAGRAAVRRRRRAAAGRVPAAAGGAWARAAGARRRRRPADARGGAY